MKLRLGYVLIGFGIVLGACDGPQIRDWQVGGTCVEKTCYKVIIRSEIRKKSYWEGHSSEEVLKDKIVVNRKKPDRVEEILPEIECKGSGRCINRRISLLDCGNVIIPVADQNLFSINGKEISQFSCTKGINIGSYPEPIG